MTGLPRRWREAWLAAAAAEAAPPAERAAAKPTAWTVLRPDADEPSVPSDEAFRFELESPHISTRGSGVFRWFRGDEAPVVGEQARGFLKDSLHIAPPDAPSLAAVGGRAFDSKREGADGPWSQLGVASLVVPRVLERDGWITIWVEPGQTLLSALDAGKAGWSDPFRPPRTGDEGRIRLERDDPRRFEEGVRAAVRQIRAGHLAKVVLSRRTRLQGGFSADHVARRLRRADERSARFSVGFGTRTFLGSTPELLVRRVRGLVETEALAGSAPPEREADLLSSTKDRDEHARVVEHIDQVASGLGAAAEHPSEPALRRLGYVTHLWTPVTLEGAPALDAWAWAQALHPTPAIGGWPEAPALALIRDLEAAPRGWYCGAVGWLDAEGDGELFVALRSALVEPAAATLFVGVGVVEGSDPRREWDETLWKERAMLEAFGAVKIDAVRAGSG